MSNRHYTGTRELEYATLLWSCWLARLNFIDAGAVAAGLEKYIGHVPGVLFALALIDASIIAAAAVSLATAYAVSDVLSIRHSLHRKPREAKAFYS